MRLVRSWESRQDDRLARLLLIDNVTADPGTGGATFAADDIGGVHFPRTKIVVGADGVNDGDVASGNPLPVTGTVAVTNAGLTELAAAINASNQMDVNIAAQGVALPVTDNGGSLTVDGTVAATNAGTFAVQESGAALTALQLIDDTVFAEDVGATAADKGIAVLAVRRDADTSLVGTDNDYANLQVNANGALKVEVFDGGDSHTVDGTVAVSSITTSVTPGSAATNLGKAEDAAHASGDVGVMALAVQQTADAALAGLTGDYAPLQVDDNGFLKVNIKAGAGSGGTASTDDSAFTAAVGSGTPMMGFVTADAVDSGDVGVLGMLANRQLKVTLFDSGGIELSVGGGTQYTEDAAAAANPVGNALNLIRDDARGGSLTTADGDNVSARGTNAGELYVKHVDAIPVTDNSGSLTVDAVNLDIRDLTSASDSVAAVCTNAGTFAVQESGAALTALQLIDDTVFAEDVPATAADKGISILAVRRDADTSLVGADNDYAQLQVNANGALKVEIFDGGDSHTVDGSVSITGSVAVTNAGTFAVQESGAALTALQLIDNASIADDAAFTPATTGVQMAGFFADETSTDSVDEGDGGAARMTLDRRQITVPQPHATGGLTIFRSIDLDETEEEVKATAGAVYGMWVTNTATATRWVKFYNATAATVVVGTTVPVITIGIPGNSSDDISGNFGPGGVGIQFDTAITVAATTGVADADVGAPAANDVIVNIFYK